MLKCGLQYEGTMRQGDINNQGINDTLRYAILAEDYLKINLLNKYKRIITIWEEKPKKQTNLLLLYVNKNRNI